MMLRLFILLTAALCARAQPSANTLCASAAKVPFAQVEGRVAVRPKAEMSGFAKQFRVQGSATVEICIAESGEVVSAGLLKVHPLLAEDALRTAKAWRFQPSTGGPVKTTLVMDFHLGGTPQEIAEEKKNNERFFAALQRCRDALAGDGGKKAVDFCTTSATLAEKLPSERQNERRTAYGSLAQAHYFSRQFDEAYRVAQKELGIAEATLTPDEAEWGYAHYHAAMASHALGKSAAAAQHYAKAEKSLVSALTATTLPEPKLAYPRTLKRIREGYAELLEQMGDKAAAAEVRKRM